MRCHRWHVRAALQVRLRKMFDDSQAAQFARRFARWRNFLYGRRRLRAWLALRLQALARRYAARCAFLPRLARDRAARRIQPVWRGALARFRATTLRLQLRVCDCD